MIKFQCRYQGKKSKAICQVAYTAQTKFLGDASR
jgi:hypothetical protein